MESRIIKFPSRKHSNVVPIKAIPGHFATNHSHINYYIDLTTMKARANEAQSAAHALAQQYVHDTIVDTIVCLDGTQVIGAYLAEELTQAGFMSRNAHQTIYVMQPEYISSSQLLFRENMEPMVRGKNIILLMASVTTGVSVRKGVECIEYYGGIIQGVSCLFSAVNEVDGLSINSLFTPKDITGYASYPHKDCPFCKKGMRVEALVNSFGYSRL
ncbi:MAG: orotate phosphoribosyltransferase [Lachnospiraceae bacterium]|nr:orotate phosphoribosyltransferase [Lachnospiraceae bacterium]